MNVVFLSRLFYPHIGGVENHVEELSLDLIQRGYQITVVTEQYDGSINLQENYKDIEIIRIPQRHLQSKSALWRYMWTQRQVFAEADVIHAHDVFWWYLPIRFTSTKPIYTTFHGWEGIYPVPTKAKLWRYMADKLSKNTIQVGDFISRWYPTNSQVTTYGATSMQTLKPGDKDRILVIGRLSHDNDIGQVIKALKLIKEEIPNLKVTFLGDGDLAWEAKEIGNVLGFKRDIKQYLSQAHWVIASSYLSILDSLAAGRTVFSVYSNPLKKDYLTSHPVAQGIHITGSAAELAAKFIGEHRDQKPHASLVSSAQQWAREQTWNQLADHYIQLWTDHNYQFAYQKLQLDLDKG